MSSFVILVEKNYTTTLFTSILFMMKKTRSLFLLPFAMLIASLQWGYAQGVTEYKVVTVVESIVPGGLGRSRMIENQEDRNVNDLTTDRTDGKKSDQGKVKRKDAKIDKFKEAKLLNFYSAVGINFQNIASNDALITSKLNQLASEGWELAFVTSGVESDSGTPADDKGGQSDGKGIFVTRLIFKRTR